MMDKLSEGLKKMVDKKVLDDKNKLDE